MNYVPVSIDPTDGGQSKYRARIMEQDRRFCEAVRRAHFQPRRIARAPSEALPVPPADPEPMGAPKPKVRDWWWFAELPAVDAPVPAPRQGMPRWKRIIAEIAAKHEVTPVELCSHRRQKALAAARHEAMYRMRNETLMTTPEIGRRLGGRDHTTVLHGLKRYEAAIAAARKAVQR